jgi:hypothetical protein
MPPKKQVENVARLSTEDQIAYLFHQYEGFADWRIGVDKRLGDVETSNQELAEGMKLLVANMANMKDTVQVSGQMATQNHLLLQKVLLAVQGQTDAGLEVPGMSARMSRLEERATKAEEKSSALEAKNVEYDNFRFRVYLVAGLIATTLGGLSLRFAPYLSQILALISK